MARYPITIFLSAFLLFQVQPLVGKYILPWFGGSPAVWTTCMLFFQVVLLLGYAYAHFITSRLSLRGQTLLHCGLLLASIAFLPIAPSAVWKPSGDELPIGRILALLGGTIGLPYFLLSSTGPLLQESFRRETGLTPYRLYSLSNIGSLLALLTYPFVFEPQLKLHTQIVGWSIGYSAFAVLSGWCAWNFSRAGAVASPVETQAVLPAERPRAGEIILWLSLAACGSIMLLATTNQLTLEISAVPFLWVVPLSLYLLTFILCFDHAWWYHRGTFRVLLVVAVVVACFAITKGNDLNMWESVPNAYEQLGLYSITMFICCMVCHGELVAAKPAPQYATLFYLMVAAGGALGGIFVAIVAPLFLRDLWEFQIGLAATVILSIFGTYALASGPYSASRTRWIVGGLIGVALALGVGASLNGQFSADLFDTNLETTRNFYGVLRVNEIDNIDDDNGGYRKLVHGRIEHGLQYLDRERRLWPTTYYGHDSGVGIAIDQHPRRAASDSDGRLRIGVVGLGCGTLAAYGQQGDYIRFYEINPDVVRVSEQYFTYRKDTPAEVEVVLGDARIEMERELATGQPQQFDVLAIDAFSSDAIPMHLLTKESVAVFLEHLKPDGLLCIHISNRFLDLAPVVSGISKELHHTCVFVDSEGDVSVGSDRSTWAIVTNNQDFLNQDAVKKAIAPPETYNRPPIVWTDDYGSLWQVFEGK